MAMQLTPAEYKLLKAQAHHLQPVVTIGEKGLTDAVLREIDVSLKSHELIKIKVASDDRAHRQACLLGICEALDATPIQHIGKTLVVYRENADPPPQRASRASRTTSKRGRRM